LMTSCSRDISLAFLIDSYSPVHLRTASQGNGDGPIPGRVPVMGSRAAVDDRCRLTLASDAARAANL
jgi:hypothetical protein